MYWIALPRLSPWQWLGLSPRRWILFLSDPNRECGPENPQPKHKTRLTKAQIQKCRMRITVDFVVKLHGIKDNKHQFICIYRPMFYTILCFPASRIQRMLSWYCCWTLSVTVALISSSTVAAIASVSKRSAESPEVQTQRNGPKPSEKISLQQKGKDQ